VSAPAVGAAKIAPPAGGGGPAAPSGAAAEPAASAGVAVTLQHVRDAWPEILETVQRARRSAWAVVYTSHPRDLKGDVLTLSFVSRGDVESFRQASPTGGGVSEVLRTAILEVLGVRVKFLPKVDGAERPAAPAAQPVQPDAVAPASWGSPPPEDVPPPEPDYGPEPEYEAAPEQAAQPQPAQPKRAAAPAARRTPPVRPDEAERYGESVVREILGASFLEETVISPSEVR
jgi:DNA polymerase-3 subunit gamma/tau